MDTDRIDPKIFPDEIPEAEWRSLMNEEGLSEYEAKLLWRLAAAITLVDHNADGVRHQLTLAFREMRIAGRVLNIVIQVCKSNITTLTAERDECRAELQRIGRKAFWAAGKKHGQ